MEALKGFGDFKIGGKVIGTVKYADDLMLLANKETVLLGVTDRLTEVGRCDGMEMDVAKNYGDENLKATISSIDYYKPKTTGECGIFQTFG
jgi:hypothetical protein